MTTFTVTMTADVVNADDGKLSLREALARANATAAADTIVFASGLEGRTLTLTGGELVLRRDMTIDGDRNDDGVEVALSGGDTQRIIRTSGAETDVGLADMALIHGYAPRGGAVFVGGGSLTVIGSTVSHNVAWCRDAGEGEGISSGLGGRLSIFNSTVTGNQAVGYESGAEGGIDAAPKSMSGYEKRPISGTLVREGHRGVNPVIAAQGKEIVSFVRANSAIARNAWRSWGGALLIMLLVVLGSTNAPAQAAPDIVIILIETTGATVIGPVKRTLKVATPNIDALAAGGTTFTQGYSAPVCVPSRAMTLLGRWPWRNSSGAIWNNGPQPPSSTVTIAERLRARGYATAAVGKWHLGFAGGRHPLDQGFDQFLGFQGTTPNYFGHDPDAPLYRNRAPIRNTGYITDTLATEAVRILRAPRTKPLFLYIPFMALHPPLQTTFEFAWQAVDRAVGEIVAAAKPNTLFMFAADHGSARNAPLKGGKYDIWDGGIRVPFIVAWSGHISRGQRVTTPVSLLDVAPTAMAAAGAPVPADLDGLSLLASVPANRNVFFGAYGHAGYAVRQGKWKLYKDYEGVPTQLYDVLADEGESRNVAAGNGPVVQSLSRAIVAWKNTLDD